MPAQPCLWLHARRRFERGDPAARPTHALQRHDQLLYPADGDVERDGRVERAGDTYAHDAHGRVIETFADGSRAQTQYTDFGDVLREVDRAGRVTDYERVPTALA